MRPCPPRSFPRKKVLFRDRSLRFHLLRVPGVELVVTADACEVSSASWFKPLRQLHTTPGIGTHPPGSPSLDQPPDFSRNSSRHGGASPITERCRRDDHRDTCAARQDAGGEGPAGSTRTQQRRCRSAHDQRLALVEDLPGSGHENAPPAVASGASAWGLWDSGCWTRPGSYRPGPPRVISRACP